MLKLTITLFADDQGLQQAARQLAQDTAMRRCEVSHRAGGLAAAHERFQAGAAPDLAVIEVGGADPDQILQALDALADDTPETTRVAVAGHLDSARFYRQLLKRGVEAYLILPTSSTELLDVVESTFAGSDQGRSRIVPVFGVKGGAGTSTVAANLALRLAHRGVGEVCLIDADPAFGTQALDFDEDPRRGLRSALHNAETLSDKTIDRYLLRRDDGLALLTDVSQLADEPVLTAERIARLIDVLDRNFEYLVIDLPNAWDEVTRELLRTAHDLVAVAEPRLQDIANLQLLSDYVRQARPGSPLHLVLNRDGLVRQVQPSRDNFAKVVGQAVMAAIPYDKQLSVAAQEGELAAMRPRRHKRVVREIDKLVTALAPAGRGAKGYAPAGQWRRPALRRRPRAA